MIGKQLSEPNGQTAIYTFALEQDRVLYRLTLCDVVQSSKSHLHVA